MDGRVVIPIGESGPKLKREKGRSLIGFPDNYVVIDIETTGLSPEYDYIIEISALKVINGITADSFSSLIKPEENYIEADEDDMDYYPKDYITNQDGERYYYIDEFIENLTGITNEMLNDAPVIEEVLPRFERFISDSILIGHNVNFDINFLYDEFERIINRKLVNEYIDTMRIAKKIYPELEHHRLSDIAEKCGVDTVGAHRALKDCEITNNAFIRMKRDVQEKYEDINEFCAIKKSHYSDQITKAKNITSTSAEFDESHPLFGKRCVITGALEKMTRQEAMQIIANLGGINEDNVTKKTNYLILGNNDYNRTKQKGKSTKYLKAEQYKLAKCEIEMIPEQVFYDMVNNN